MTNPVFGQNPFTGFIYYAEQIKTLQTENISVHKGSFYYNVKMIKRGFLFSLRRGGNLPPAKTRSVFLYFSALCADTIAATPRANS